MVYHKLSFYCKQDDDNKSKSLKLVLLRDADMWCSSAQLSGKSFFSIDFYLWIKISFKDCSEAKFSRTIEDDILIDNEYIIFFPLNEKHA